MSAGSVHGTLCAMRILLVNHGTAGEWGGDGVQLREAGKRLIQRGTRWSPLMPIVLM